jgi:ferredoxin
MAKVIIHRDSCIGCTLCEDLAPEVFAIIADGRVSLKTEEVEGEIEKKAKDAEANCPAKAIHLEKNSPKNSDKKNVDKKGKL